MFTLIAITDTGNTVRRCHEIELGYVGLSSTLNYFRSSCGVLSG